VILGKPPGHDEGHMAKLRERLVDPESKIFWKSSKGLPDFWTYRYKLDKIRTTKGWQDCQ
jgi:hypothetical protein